MMQLKSRHLFSTKTIIAYLIILLACFTLFESYAARPKPLPQDQAFKFSLRSHSQQKMIASWTIAPEYYLYRDRIQVSVQSKEIKAKLILPPGKKKVDINGDAYQAYAGELNVPILLDKPVNNLSLQISYQGCASQGFCYPPTTKEMSVKLSDYAKIQAKAKKVDKLALQSFSEKVTDAIPTTTQKMAAITSLTKDQNNVRDLFGARSMALTLLIFAGIGLLLAFTPCVLPMIPILTSIIVGQHLSTRKAFWLSVLYVFGAAISYALVGVVAALMGNSLQVWLQQPIAIALASLLFVLLALSLFGLFEIRLPGVWHNQLTRLSNQQQGGRFVGVFIMGMISTLIVSPCVTAPLVGVLMYIGQTGDVVFGASALFTLGIGMGVPLVLIGTSAGKWLPKAGPWMEAIKKFFGFLMIAMAIWLISRVISLENTFILWGCYMIIAAVFLGLYLPRLIGMRALNRIMGMMIWSTGMLVIAAGVSPDLLSRWIALRSEPSVFTVVRNVQEVQENIARAKDAGKPVLLDFYADWCESCVSMDRKVFTLPKVKKELNDYVVLRADLSSNSAFDNNLLSYFDVVAPPTVLFFGADGREVNTKRIVGEVNAKEFLARLK